MPPGGRSPGRSPRDSKEIVRNQAFKQGDQGSTAGKRGSVATTFQAVEVESGEPDGEIE
jgi:hypothetical protein